MEFQHLPKLLIVDLCHTLIAENTTRAFLDDWLLREGWRRALRRSVLGRKWPTCVLGLRGLPKSLLYKQAEAYVRDRLARLGNPEVTKAVQRAQKHNIPVYVASASIDPIVESVVKVLNLNGAVSSRLRYDRRDRCIGMFACNLTGKKLEHLRRMLPDSSLREAAVYTDNVEDTDILRVARYPHFLGTAQALSELSESELARIAFL